MGNQQKKCEYCKKRNLNTQKELIWSLTFQERWNHQQKNSDCVCQQHPFQSEHVSLSILQMVLRKAPAFIQKWLYFSVPPNWETQNYFFTSSEIRYLDMIRSSDMTYDLFCPTGHRWGPPRLPLSKFFQIVKVSTSTRTFHLLKVYSFHLFHVLAPSLIHYTYKVT